MKLFYNKVCEISWVPELWFLERDSAVECSGCQKKLFSGTLRTSSRVPSSSIIFERRQTSLQLIPPKLGNLHQSSLKWTNWTTGKRKICIFDSGCSAIKSVGINRIFFIFLFLFLFWLDAQHGPMCNLRKCDVETWRLQCTHTRKM